MPVEKAEKKENQRNIRLIRNIMANRYDFDVIKKIRMLTHPADVQTRSSIRPLWVGWLGNKAVWPNTQRKRLACL
jgi:hypothetical protein